MQLTLDLPLVGFVDDDAGYLAWLTANPAGYVLNTTRSPHRDYLMLHRAGCRYISGDDGRCWTVNYAKVCGPSTVLLDTWAEHRVGGEADRCAFCQP